MRRSFKRLGTLVTHLVAAVGRPAAQCDWRRVERSRGLSSGSGRVLRQI